MGNYIHSHVSKDCSLVEGLTLIPNYNLMASLKTLSKCHYIPREARHYKFRDTTVCNKIQGERTLWDQITLRSIEFTGTSVEIRQAEWMQKFQEEWMLYSRVKFFSQRTASWKPVAQSIRTEVKSLRRSSTKWKGITSHGVVLMRKLMLLLSGSGVGDWISF